MYMCWVAEPVFFSFTRYSKNSRTSCYGAGLLRVYPGGLADGHRSTCGRRGTSRWSPRECRRRVIADGHRPGRGGRAQKPMDTRKDAASRATADGSERIVVVLGLVRVAAAQMARGLF